MWITLKPNDPNAWKLKFGERLGPAGAETLENVSLDTLRFNPSRKLIDAGLSLPQAPADRGLFDSFKAWLTDVVEGASLVALEVRYPIGQVSLDDFAGLHFPEIKSRLAMEIDLDPNWLEPSDYEMNASGESPCLTLVVENDLTSRTLAQRRGKQVLMRLILDGCGEKCEAGVKVGDLVVEERLLLTPASSKTDTSIGSSPVIRQNGEENSQVHRPTDPPAKVTRTNTGSLSEVQPTEVHLHGRPINGAKPEPIASLNDERRVVIEGEIFNIEVKETRAKRVIFRFAVTDGTDSIQAMMWLNKPTEVPKGVVDGVRLKIRGNLKRNNFEQDELQLEAQDIVLMPPRAVRMDNAPRKRVELHAHTKMSAADSVVDITAYIKRAVKWGHPAVAITDHGVVHAFPKAYSAVKGSDTKLLLGCEAYLVEDTDFLANKGKEKLNPPPYHHIILLVKNEIGRKNLYRLITHSHIKTFYRKPLISREMLLQHREGLIFGSACEAGELFRAIIDKKEDAQLESIASMYDYLEVQTTGNNQFMIRNGQARDEEALRDYVRKIISLGKKLGKPVVATSDMHFLDPEDEIYRRILQVGNGFEDGENQPPLYFHTTEEMLKEFDWLDEETRNAIVIDNTQLVAGWCDSVRPVPKGRFFPNMAGADESVRMLSWKRVREVYGDPPPKLVNDRVNRELDAVIGNKFGVLYEIARLLVKESNDRGYSVGSRGSVGSSLVAWLLGITEVNPLPAHYRCPECFKSEFFATERLCGVDLRQKRCSDCETPVEMIRDGYNIPFETFVGFKGDKVPDIDLNFAPEVQGIVQKYARDLFGEGNAYKAGTINTLAGKTAWGYVKNYYGTKGEAKRRVEIDRIKTGLEGVKRTSGQHPGGVILVRPDNDIEDFTPVQYSGDMKEMGGKESVQKEDLYTTHFDYHAIDENLVKLDILGKDDGSAFKHLQDITGVAETDVPLTDRMAISIFSSQKHMNFVELTAEEKELFGTTGAVAIPEFGTENTRRMLELTRPKNFTELIYISGLSHGTDVWANNAETLIKNKTATLETVISTRDDIMNTLIQKGMDPARAFKITEKVRKGGASRDGFTKEEEDSLKAVKAPGWWIESCKKIQYMFPKAHAAAYCFTAVRMAWFKTHHPWAFYCSWLTLHAEAVDGTLLQKGRQPMLGRIRELRSLVQQRKATAKEASNLNALMVAYEALLRGIEFAPVDLYKSHARRFSPLEPVNGGGYRLLTPLIALEGLGTKAAENVDEERQKGEFRSVEDLADRAGLNKSVIETLNEAGALKVLPKTNQITLF